MKYICILITILLSHIFSFSQLPFRDGYYLPQRSGQTSIFKQKGDTIISYHCNAMGLDYCIVGSYSKILQVSNRSTFFIYQLEIIDTIREVKKELNYSILAIKTLDSNRLYFTGKQFKTKKELNNYSDTIDLNNEFGLTLYSKSYFYSFSKLKTISTKAEAQQVLDLMNPDHFKDIFERYKKAASQDPYGSFFTAELINLACLKLGFNPINANTRINKIMRE